MKKKIPVYLRIELILIILTVLMGLVTLSPSLCDFYTDNIYGYIADGLGYINSFVPFAVGEIVMYIGALVFILAVIFLVLLIFLRRRQGYRRFCAVYYKTLLVALTALVCIYMPTWYVPFCGTVLGRGTQEQKTVFSDKELYALYSYVVDGANAAAAEIHIAEDGSVDFLSPEEYRKKMESAMRNFSDEFPRLDGYYPPVKTALCSDILDRMNIGGYTYPFTMEMTHTKYTDPVYLPLLDAHETAHHMGYYKESEANLVSQITLSSSDDPFLRLAAFMDMYRYIEEDYDMMISRIITELEESGQLRYPDASGAQTKEEKAERFWTMLEMKSQALNEILGEGHTLDERVYEIIDQANQIEEEIYESDAHPIDDLPAVNDAIEETAVFGWSTQADILKENNYDGVLLLLLQYFDGEL
ncbi:MAG: DUF3810 family protein [Ruminococcus sp.]|nr:DUF3810 family protein [Ruminococcus sp.]